MVATATASSSSTNGKASKKKANKSKDKSTDKTAKVLTTKEAAKVDGQKKKANKPNKQTAQEMGLSPEQLAQWRKLYDNTVSTRNEMIGAKEDYKLAKESHGHANSQLVEFCRNILYPSPTPLLNNVKPLEKKTEIKVVDPKDDSWKQLSIGDSLVSLGGLSASIASKLAEANINTMGDLTEFTKPSPSGYCKQISDIKGVGGKAAEKIEEASAKFWQNYKPPVVENPTATEAATATASDEATATEVEAQVEAQVPATVEEENSKHASKSDEFRAGYQAFKDDFSITDNPEPKGSANYHDWRSGWQEAESEQTQNLDSNDPSGE